MKTIIGILIIAVMLSACGGTSGIAPEPSVNGSTVYEAETELLQRQVNKSRPEFNER